MAKMQERNDFWSEKFPEMDANGSGSVSIQEMKKFVEGLGCSLSDADIAIMFMDIDTDGNKQITKDEFINVMSKKNRRDAFREQFEKMDTDGSGTLDRGELVQFLKGSGYVEDADIDSMIDSVDTNSDGKVSLEEFLKIC